MSVIEDRFKAICVALDYATLKYRDVCKKYKSGPEVVNANEIYSKHMKEYEKAKKELEHYQDSLYKNSSLKFKK
jgi:hypothetical protein